VKFDCLLGMASSFRGIRRRAMRRPGLPRKSAHP